MYVKQLLNMGVFFFEHRLFEEGERYITFWSNWKERDADESSLVAAFLNWLGGKSPGEIFKAKEERAQRQRFKVFADDVFKIGGVEKIVIRNFDISVTLENPGLWKVYGLQIAEVVRKHFIK